MKLRLHIERLVLDGLPLEGRHGVVVGREISRELERLLREQGLGSNMKTSGAHWRIESGSLDLQEKSAPVTIGRGIAQSIYAGIGSAGIGSDEHDKGGRRR
jgi:hypothetical protein